MRRWRCFENLGMNRERPIRLRAAGVERVLLPQNLVYAESARRVAHLHLDEGVLESYVKLSELEKMLPVYFLRCHKSYLINMNYISEYRANRLVLSTGDVVPVSQSRRPQVKERVSHFIRAVR